MNCIIFKAKVKAEYNYKLFMHNNYDVLKYKYTVLTKIQNVYIIVLEREMIIWKHSL